MKKFALLAATAATAAMALTATVATAQPYGNAYGYHRNHDGYARDSRAWRDSDGRSDAQEWNRDRDRDGRPDQYDRNDSRRGGYSQRYGSSYGYGRSAYAYDQSAYGYDQSAYGYGGGYRQGQRYPYYNQRQYMIDDYRAYNLPPPRSGYRYYRSDNNDVVMVAIASGLIGAIIGGALNDNNHHDGYHHR